MDNVDGLVMGFGKHVFISCLQSSSRKLIGLQVSLSICVERGAERGNGEIITVVHRLYAIPLVKVSVMAP